MKRFGTLSIALVFVGALPVACTDPEGTTTSASTSSSSSASSTSSSSGAMGDGVKGTAIDSFKPSTGDLKKPNTTAWTSIAAIADKVYPGTIDAQGNIDLPGVPQGSYLLALTLPAAANLPNEQPVQLFYETDARVVNLERVFSGRPDIAPITQPTYLTLAASLAPAWHAYEEDMNGMVIEAREDQLEFVSRNGMVEGVISAGASLPEDQPPTNGATSVFGWKIDAQSVFGDFGFGRSLVDTKKGDDFHVLREVMEQEGMPSPDGDPWQGYFYTHATQSFDVATMTMTDGGTTAISGDFAPLTMKKFAMDYRGSAFQAQFGSAPYDRTFTTFGVTYEAGTPEPALGAFAQLLNFSFPSGTKYTNPNPACHGAACDMAACGGTCDLGQMVPPGDHSFQYDYGNPFTSGQELVSVGVYYYHNVRSQLPEGTVENLLGSFLIEVPAGDLNGKPIQPTLGTPENIKVNNAATSFDAPTTNIGTTPTITWSAPTLGKPTHYRIHAFDLTDVKDSAGLNVRRRRVATFHVQGTSVTIPEGILLAGRYYYFQVAALMNENHDSAHPLVFATRQFTSTMFTGIVTP